jgi:hypothetical protein
METEVNFNHPEHVSLPKEVQEQIAIGVSVLVRSDDSDKDFIGKVINISEDKQTLEVNWYYTKYDLPRKYAEYLKFLSENEVFVSNHRDRIDAECVNDICRVLTWEEFEKHDTTTPDIYFCRARYDHRQKELAVPVDKWPKHCLCKTPINPDRGIIQCDNCTKWYHLECLNLTKEVADTIEQYKCPECKGTASRKELSLAKKSKPIHKVSNTPQNQPKTINKGTTKVAKPRTQKETPTTTSSLAPTSFIEQILKKYGVAPSLTAKEMMSDISKLRNMIQEQALQSNTSTEMDSDFEDNSTAQFPL